MLPIRLASRTSAMTGCSGRAPLTSPGSRKPSKMLVPPWPSRISSAGFQRLTWRQSSRPIEPPAPVTSTRLPASVRPTASSPLLPRPPHAVDFLLQLLFVVVHKSHRAEAKLRIAKDLAHHHRSGIASADHHH